MYWFFIYFNYFILYILYNFQKKFIFNFTFTLFKYMCTTVFNFIFLYIHEFFFYVSSFLFFDVEIIIIFLITVHVQHVIYNNYWIWRFSSICFESSLFMFHIFLNWIVFDWKLKYFFVWLLSFFLCKLITEQLI